MEFPCPFSIKVIGEDHGDYQQFVIDTMHACGVIELGEVSSRVRTKNKYLAVTVPFTAQSREQLDAIELHVLARAYYAAWRHVHQEVPLHEHALPGLDLVIEYLPEH